MDIVETTDELRIVRRGSPLGYPFFIFFSVIAVVILAFAVRQNLRLLVGVITFVGPLFALAVLALRMAMYKRVVTFAPHMKRVTVETRSLLHPFSREETYDVDAISDIQVRQVNRGNLVGYSVALILMNNKEVLLRTLPEQSTAIAFKDKVFSLLSRKVSEKPAVERQPVPKQLHSYREGNLIVVQSNFVVGLAGLAVFITFLLGYLYLEHLLYQGEKPGGHLSATPILDAIIAWALPVMFVAFSCFFFAYIFTGRATSFDVRSRSITIRKRSLFGGYSTLKTYRWDQVKSVVVEAIPGAKGVVYYQVYLVIPGLEPRVFVKRFNTKGAASVLSNEVASLIGVPEESTA